MALRLPDHATHEAADGHEPEQQPGPPQPRPQQVHAADELSDARPPAGLSRRRQATPALIAAGDLRIDLARRQVTCGGADVRLTPTEYALLTALATNAGRVLTHQWLLQHAWGSGYEDNVQNLHVFISQLRRKIEPQPARPRYILTEPGIGYRFSTADPVQP